MRLTLEFKNYEVEEAVNGLEGLEALAKNTYDLVFCDLSMPGMNGEEVIRRIRKDMSLKDLPIIVISAEEREAKNRAMMCGATDFIDKPFYPGQIFEMIERFLDKD